MTDEKAIQEVSPEEEDREKIPVDSSMIEEMIKLGESGDKEALIEYIEKLFAVKTDTSDLKPETAQGMRKDRILGFLLRLVKGIIPETLWLKWIFRLDEKFLFTMAVLKARHQGLQINFGGKVFYNPPGERKGRIYLRPAGNDYVNLNKLILTVRKDFPVRTRRYFVNLERLNELRGAQ